MNDDPGREKLNVGTHELIGQKIQYCTVQCCMQCGMKLPVAINCCFCQIIVTFLFS